MKTAEKTFGFSQITFFWYRDKTLPKEFWKVFWHGKKN
jgi:hypothetical protein